MISKNQLLVLVFVKKKQNKLELVKWEIFNWLDTHVSQIVGE